MFARLKSFVADNHASAAPLVDPAAQPAGLESSVLTPEEAHLASLRAQNALLDFESMLDQARADVAEQERLLELARRKCELFAQMPDANTHSARRVMRSLKRHISEHEAAIENLRAVYCEGLDVLENNKREYRRAGVEV